MIKRPFYYFIIFRALRPLPRTEITRVFGERGEAWMRWEGTLQPSKSIQVSIPHPSGWVYVLGKGGQRRRWVYYRYQDRILRGTLQLPVREAEEELADAAGEQKPKRG